MNFVGNKPDSSLVVALLTCCVARKRATVQRVEEDKQKKEKNDMAKSMALNSAAGLSGMLKAGHTSHEGLEGAVFKNIAAAKAIAGMVQTSLGPNGMNKLVVNHLEKIIVTSDCATIVKELEVQHPAAKMLVMASEMQESEYGDNTNFVSSLGSE